MVKFGLETKETVDAFESMFENYVPLAGRATDETTGSQYPTGGAGMIVFGPTTRRATGRKSQAVNVVAQMGSDRSDIVNLGAANLKVMIYTETRESA